jgi:hypothetical protein
VKRARSHPVALGQVRGILRELGLQPVIEADTAGAAHLVAGIGGVEDAAIASALAAEIYGLEILRRNVEDAAHNTTRFYVCAPRPRTPPPDAPGCVTTFVFRVRNIPAALYKALGGFATNGVNMTKLESYMLDGEFTATQFLADVDGHPEHPAVARALEELGLLLARAAGAGDVPRAPLPAGAPGRSGPLTGADPLRRVHCVRPQVRQAAHLQGGQVRRFQQHGRRHADAPRLLPPGRAHAPAVARLEAGEADLRDRRHEVVAAGLAEGQEVRRDLHADHVQPVVLRSGVAAAVAEEAGERRDRAGQQRAAQHVPPFGPVLRYHAAARMAAAFTSSPTVPAKVSKFASNRATKSRAVRS